MPMCEWTNSERSYATQLWPLTCDTPEVPWDGTWNDHCTFAPGVPRPSNTVYWIVPRDRNDVWVADIQWPDGSVMYSDWIEVCRRTDSTSLVDHVDQNLIDGAFVPGGSCWPTATAKSILTEIYGGTVEHIRPALVRGQIVLGYPWDYPDPLTVTLAIQTFEAAGWTDFAISQGAVGATPTLFEVRANVPPGRDVRLQVRANWLCFSQPSESYDLRAANIALETCVPDQSNPGSCL